MEPETHRAKSERKQGAPRSPPAKRNRRQRLLPDGAWLLFG
jgi:hypothetical protein